MAFYRGSRPGTIPESGAIFMSNESTKYESFRRGLLGLPSGFADFVKHVRVGMLLFLFEHERRELYGVFEAVSDGDIDIVPDAYMSSGKKFPAQVRFDILWNCHPIPESTFRHAIGENYFGAYKFKFGLCKEQVVRLLYLFNSQRVVPCRTLGNRLHPMFPMKESQDNEPEVAIESPDNEPEVAMALKMPDDMLPAVSDEYIPLSYSSDSEDSLYEDEPKTVSKGLYSDNLARKSVFSRLKLPLEAAASKKRKYKSNTADKNSAKVVTMCDPVPRIKRENSEGNNSSWC